MFLSFLKKYENFLRKSLEIKNKALPLHPLSPLKMANSESRGSKKYFEKSHQKIW